MTLVAPTTLLAVLLLLVGLGIALQVSLLLRKPKLEMPADIDTRLRLLEQNVQAIVQGHARLEGASQGIERRVQSFAGEMGTEARNGRIELVKAFQAFESKLELRHAALKTSLGQRQTSFEGRVQERFEALTQGARETLESLKRDVTTQLSVMSSAMKDQLEGNGSQLRNQFATLQESVAQQLQAMAAGSRQASDQVRVTLNERLASIQDDNSKKLEEMRRTVDEKLHATLEQRLGDSFKLVSERLEQVHAGLGEMKTLAGSVGDLKRVMSNVRARGTWGEVQLGAIIESLFTAEQFQRNVKTVPGSNELVEYAVRLPGKIDESPVWLPIDSKYPVEHYQRLMDAHELMDK
ncbi:MAG TPA: DNA recombination protein RmuC, partial [Burkholderiaceae bacterium]|nr:DNA recombination protein RmuC [Burkholderiaceae bacterium]